MTREEYKRLLNSDYWKGYSYSLIKERNFTCEDCGRRFYNERNKLQVHHLVYRDIYPWSYRPEELIVLCEECHRKRHGILEEPAQEIHTTHSQETFGVNFQTDPSSTRNREYSETDRWGNTKKVRDGRDSRNPYNIEPENRFKFKYVLFGLLFLLVISLGYNMIGKQTTSIKEELSSKPMPPTTDVEEPTNDKPVSPLPQVKRIESSTATTNDPINETPQNNNVDGKITHQKPEKELSTIELLEKRNHENVVRQARSAGVSTKGSTLEILERMNHADVVRQARSAGVSTEGSTLEILERMNHADVVRQAKRVGVSTEGSTLEILERINRKEIEQMNW